MSYKWHITLWAQCSLTIIAFVIFLSPNHSYAQEKKPKVALVLSGGGAKGIAHIPVLQALDSLNIVPDLIVGTSMGSVVGGLYAMGYSGNQIANLVSDMNWDNLLYEKTPFSDVSVEEKSEFGKYLIGLDIVDGKPKTTSYILNDQNLRIELALLTAPYFKDIDFDDLPIPLRMVTTDITNYKTMVISEGSLSTGMRASMSIPGVFEPVTYNNTYLVDGGVLNNFPTDIAKAMGADIIIGSDVSGPGKDVEDLNSIADILVQTSMIQNYSLYPSNRKLCSIIIDHVPYLNYSVSDFNKSNELYREGKIASNLKTKELSLLAKQLSKFNQNEILFPTEKDSLIFDNIVYENISQDNSELLKSRMNLVPKQHYSLEEIGEAITRSMGTNVFRKLTYKSVTNDTEENLIIKGYENSKHQFNAALHYDLYRGFGLVGNYTGRNILGQASRLIVNLDISEQPKLLLQAQKNFGTKKQWWWRSDVTGRSLIQRVFINGQYADDFKEKFIRISNQFNKNINSLNSYFGISLNYEYIHLKPTANPEFTDNLFILEEYYSPYIGVDVHFVSNTFDEVFYPKQGSSFNLIIDRSIDQKVSAFFSDEDIIDVTGLNYGFTKFHMNYHKRTYLGQKVTGIFEVSTGFTFADKNSNNEISFYNAGFPQLFYLGGNLPLQRENTIGFQGLQEDEVISSQFALLKLAAQFDVYHNFYITPNVNIGSVGFDDFNEFSKNIFSPNGSWQVSEETSLLASVGAMVSYKSILGPIDFSMSWTNDVNKVRLFLSVGIPFNR